MDNEEIFLDKNKLIEEKLEHLFHIIENRLDKLFASHLQLPSDSSSYQTTAKELLKCSNPYQQASFTTFKLPYIRDFRNFSAPCSEDAKQIQQLTGNGENIDLLIQNKSWTRDSKKQLEEAVFEHYAKLHMIKLIKQKNHLLVSPSKQNDEDVAQKLRLIDEQMEQVKARKEPRIFVPQDRYDSQIDWCAISAKLSSLHDAQDCRLMWSNQLHWSINSDNQWTKDEDICLINAVAKHGKNDWDRVAKELNSGRLDWQCCVRYNQEYAFVQSSLEKDDADKIIEVINLCRIGNYVPWNQVMYFISYHSLQQVKWQWQKYCSEQADSSNWTKQEDFILLRSVKKYGQRDWSRIADCLPGRSNKSCRERYIMRLRFSKRVVGSWLRAEDSKLMSLVEKFGTNWSLISSNMPERNCHQLRNRFELLKSDIIRPCPIKRKKLIRQEDGQFIGHGFKRKLSAEDVEVNKRLKEIFTTYSNVSKNPSKSLTYRSQQDEIIYQKLVRALCDIYLGREVDGTCSLLDKIISKTIDLKPGLFMPCVPTLRGYKAWSLLQDYLKQFGSVGDQNSMFVVDDNVVQIIVSIFLWPAILSRLKKPAIDTDDYQVGSLIERSSKNLYKIRDIQRLMTIE